MTVIVEQAKKARRPSRKPKQVHPVMVRLEPALFRRLNEMADSERRSLGNLGALAIQRFLDSQPELTS